jgi:hypothetical protein
VNRAVTAGVFAAKVLLAASLSAWLVSASYAAVPVSWTNVTPAAISLDPTAFSNDNYGVQDVVVDPARPSDLYAFTCFQGVWKSVDYGQTWTKINTGTGGSSIDGGKLWTAAIDPDASRDPATPPTLWTATGDAAAGVWRSTDGGVSWTAYAVNNTTASTVSGNSYYANDVYALDIDPHDGAHLIAGFHGYPGISESTDGGQSWTTIAVPDSIGTSLYPFFVQTGLAATTRTTWLTQSQWASNTSGIWRTADGGGTWSQVAAANEHQHGSSQMYQPGNGVIYAPSVNPDGVFRSTDYGQTWSQVNSTLENAVFGTPNQIYADNSFASAGGSSANVISSPTSGTQWSTLTPVAGMSNGSKRAAVTFDGSHYIIVSGNWLAGLWRYVEDDDIFANGFE